MRIDQETTASKTQMLDKEHGDDDILDGLLHVDENNQIRLLEPDVHRKYLKLQDLIRIFLEKNEDFKKIVSSFVLSLAEVADQIEQQKIKAIGSRSLIKALEMEKEAVQEQYRNLIREKKIELERINLEHELLKREELEQKNLLQILQQIKR